MIAGEPRTIMQAAPRVGKDGRAECRANDGGNQ